MAEFYIPNDCVKPPTEQEMLERLADMSYTSPITEYLGQMRIERENAVLKAIQEFDIRVDKDELIKALQYDRDQYRKGFIDGCRGSNDRIIERVKADTVKKMRDVVKSKMVTNVLNIKFMILYEEELDQIAKEILEGGDTE
jgi:hypothetical protein